MASQTPMPGSNASGPIAFPARYEEVWDAPFRAAIEAALRPGIAVLDVGSGRNPTIPLAARPENTTYVGLDLSLSELAAAPAGSYDEQAISDVGTLQDQLLGRFDLIVSWQVLEHVEDLGAALVCIRAYLKPGGTFVAMLSGSRSAFAIANRILPFHVGAPIVKRIMRRSSSNPVFPAFYDRCHASALERLLRHWSTTRVVPFFRGAGYFGFSRGLSHAYLSYENRIEARGLSDLATHYLVVATR